MSTLVDAIVTILLFIVVLGGLVLFHELGHFVVARLAKVRVLEFGIGFPPRARILARGKPPKYDRERIAAARPAQAPDLDPVTGRLVAAGTVEPATGEPVAPEEPGGTLYTLHWLPIGGFVKLEGEDGDDDKDPHSFSRARLPVKLGILVAGVLMNLLLAFAIFTGIAWLATPFVGVTIYSVDPVSPAAGAGLVGGDSIISVDGQAFEFYGDPPTQALRERPGETVTLGIIHADGTRSTVQVTLRTTEEMGTDKGALGINAKPESGGFETLFYGAYTGRSLGEAIQIGAHETVRWFGLILSGLGNLVGSIASNPTAAPPVSGPVGIATSLGEVFRGSGPVMTLYVAGILSANLALVNILPFPPLDGGRMLVILLKAIPRYGTRISLRAERVTYAIGFVALFTFLIWITVFDIARQVGGT